MNEQNYNAFNKLTISHEMEILMRRTDLPETMEIKNKYCAKGHGIDGHNLYLKEDGKCVTCKKRRDARSNEKGLRNKKALDVYDTRMRKNDEDWFNDE